MAAGALFLKELRKTKPWRSLVYIGPDYAFGHEAYDAFLYNLKRFQVNHRLIASYWPKLYTKDYSPYIASVMRDKPDVLIVELYAGDLREFIRQGNLKKLFATTIACNFVAGGHYENFVSSKDEMPLGMYLSGSNFLNWPDTEANRNFVEKVKRSIGEYPSAIFEDFYFGVQIIAKAVEKVGNANDTVAVVKALEEMKISMPADPEGSTSYIHPETHQIVQTVAVGQVVENKAFPPALRMPGNWKFFKAEDLMPPMDYVKGLREKASQGAAKTNLINNE